MVKYAYTAYGTLKSISGSLATTIGQYNPFRFKGYYYDQESELFYCNGRYYSSELCRFIQPADISSLNLSSINGLNLYSYANNNPIGIVYSGFSVAGSSSGGMISSITKFDTSGPLEMVIRINKKINLDWLIKGLSIGSTIHGLYTSISGLVNHTIYFAKNIFPFTDDMTILGASVKDGVLAFNQFKWKFGKSDVFAVFLGVGLDVYDSYQRGVSQEGVLLGATLTAAKGIGLIYLNKGIIYGATAIGTAICPGVGTAIGFVVGGVISIIVDVFISNWLDDLIDKIAK